MKWYDLKCIQWIMQRIPDSNCFQTASLPDSWYSECHLSSSEAVHLGTRRHHSGDSGDGSKRHWMAFFRTIHHMFSAAFSRFQPFSAAFSFWGSAISQFQPLSGSNFSEFKWIQVSSRVSFESEFRGEFRVAGRGVAEALDQGLDVSLQLLGEDHLLDALLHLVPKTASATAPPRWTRFLDPRFQGPPVDGEGGHRRRLGVDLHGCGGLEGRVPRAELKG